MKDLLNTLKDQIAPQQNPSSLGGLGGLLGSAAAGGLLGALLGGSKGVRKTAKNIAYIGGGAAAASMAYSLYKKWTEKGSSQAQPHGSYQTQTAGYQSTPSQSGNVFEEFNRKNQAQAPAVNDDHAILLIEAMVFAARADGHIDSDEQNMIMKTSKSLVSDERFNSIVREALQRPLDPAYIASKVPGPDMADDIYKLSATVIVADNYMEQSYLQGLARALNINDNQKLMLESQALEFRSQL